MGQKPRICLVFSQGLPVPAVQGGAVEKLGENLALYQEQYQDLDLTIISIYDKKAAAKAATDYPHTNWQFIRCGAKEEITSLCFRLMRKITKKSFDICSYDQKVFDCISTGDFDRVIFEGGNIYSFGKYQQKFQKNQLIVHLHCVIRPEPVVKELFGASIGISQYVTNAWCESSGFLPEHAYTLMNGIDVNHFSKPVTEESRQVLRKKYGYMPSDYVVLYCGRVLAVKGIRELMKAVLLIDDPSVKLLVAGSLSVWEGCRPWYIKELRALARASKGRIRFAGYIPNDYMNCYYNMANCTAVPSLCEEGAGLVHIESLAAGTPVIATSRGGIPEYLKNADEGVRLIDINDAFVEHLSQAIISQKAEGNPSRESLTEYARRFSSEIYYRNYVSIIQKEMEKAH